MLMFENPVTLEARPELEPYFQGFDYRASGLSFSSMYMWRESNQFSWQEIGDYLCFAGISHLEIEKQEAFFFPPLTRTGSYEKESLRATVLRAKNHFEERGQRFSIRLLPNHMRFIFEEAFPEELVYLDDRPNYDYIYLADDLIRLPGRKYSAKRNHLNYFREHFKYEYVPLTSAMTEEAMKFIAEFNERKKLPPHEMELLRMEEDAMRDVFENMERVGYHGGAIRIGGKLEAFSVGGNLGKNMLTVHVEKANIEYRGAYQAINNEFCIHEAKNLTFVNREEDMDIPGLRKAKLSYHPVELLKKYIVVFKEDL